VPNQPKRRSFTRRDRGTLRRGLQFAGAGLALAFVVLLAYGLTTKARDASLDEALSRGEGLPAPGFELPPLTDSRPSDQTRSWQRAAADGRVRLDELRGTPVVLNFWASWCDPCRAEAGGLESAWRRAQRQGVLFVGLNQQDASEEAQDFLRRFSITFPQVRDRTKDTARAWGVTGMPETFFVSSGGAVVGHVIGTISESQMNDGVTAALSGRPTGVTIGGERRPTR
jgi:cytochrome c biogenesis protein CcmG, thiol:disulfide interchange protein DsbE